MALAEPAANEPPTSVAAMSPSGGMPRCAQDHGRHRGHEQQLDDAWLGQGDVGANLVHRLGGRVCGSMVGAAGVAVGRVVAIGIGQTDINVVGPAAAGSAAILAVQ